MSTLQQLSAFGAGGTEYGTGSHVKINPTNWVAQFLIDSPFIKDKDLATTLRLNIQREFSHSDIKVKVVSGRHIFPGMKSSTEAKIVYLTPFGEYLSFKRFLANYFIGDQDRYKQYYIYKKHKDEIEIENAMKRAFDRKYNFIIYTSANGSCCDFDVDDESCSQKYCLCCCGSRT